MSRKLYLMWLMVLLSGFFSIKSHAVVETYEFETDRQREQYAELVATLRCPKCQNQNIADSNAPIALDMRNAVHKQISAGKDSNDIVQYMVDRFGDFVVYKPKLDPSTYLLWFGPFLVGGLGIVFVVMIARRSRTKHDNTSELTESDKQKLTHLLEDEK